MMLLVLLLVLLLVFFYLPQYNKQPQVTFQELYQEENACIQMPNNKFKFY